MGFITTRQVELLAQKLPNDYGRYLHELIREVSSLAGQREQSVQ